MAWTVRGRAVSAASPTEAESLGNIPPSYFELAARRR